MKYKKLLCLFLALSLIVCLIGCASTAEPTAEPSKATEAAPSSEPERIQEQENDPLKSTDPAISPLLYKVTDAEGNTLWLFGSIHVGYDYFYPLPDYVYDAYESADAIAFEIDMRALEKDAGAQQQVLSQFMYTDGTTIKDHISPELYTSAVETLESYGSYFPMMDLYKPVMWFMAMDNLLYENVDLDPSLGIDYHLMDKAYADGKKILEVESAQFQYNMLSNFSPELQEFLLNNSVSNLAAPVLAQMSLRLMVKAWECGDEAAFASYFSSQSGIGLPEDDYLLYQTYTKAMIDDRNQSMTDFAEDALASGEEVFICVGAAHIVGEGAMADLLAERGYTVELVK